MINKDGHFEKISGETNKIFGKQENYLLKKTYFFLFASIIAKASSIGIPSSESHF